MNRSNVTIYLTPEDLEAIDQAKEGLFENSNRHLTMLAALRLGLEILKQDPAKGLAIVEDQSRARFCKVRRNH